tara:strand:+ start:39 stop:533 length:495 start_codon:yes stop_codon:yes gene_type:complete
MIISLKNKQTLQVDDFYFRCCIGINGLTKNKIEGDGKTPIGSFKIGDLYFRKERIELPKTYLKCVRIKSTYGWCDDVTKPNKYNKLIKITKSIHHEKLFRNDSKYDLLIPIKYNSKKRIVGKGSCIFLHLTKNYKPTAGCIALKLKDFLIMLKIINKKTQIRIY